MGRMKGNMRRTGPMIPGARGMSPPTAIADKFDRVEGNETTYYDGQLRPGPRLKRPAKRGKRISKMRTGNDAAMALTEAFRAKVGGSSGAAPSKKSDKAFFKGVGYR